MQDFIWPEEFPGAHWLDSREESAIMDVLKNGSLFRYYGLNAPKWVDKFEAAAKEYYDVDYALTVNSGTGALICSMKALGVGPGCEVIVPSFMWVATIGAVIQCGAIPVLCEIDKSFTMDIKDLENKITEKTKLIVPIHMAGAPCDMDSIMEIAAKYNLAVLEDCAQCNGGSFKGRKVGTFGDMGIFSLQLNKNMTSGEGGLIITNNKKLYKRAFSAHDMGLTRENGRLAEPAPYAQMWGEGRRMNEMCGAIASVQLDKLNDIVNSMHCSKYRIINMLQENFGLNFRQIHDQAGDTGAFVIILLEEEQNALAAIDIFKARGIHNAFRLADYGLHIYYNIKSLTKKLPSTCMGFPWEHEANRNSNYNYTKGACPNSDKLFERSILIPIPSCINNSQEKQAAEIIGSTLEKLQNEGVAV